VPNRIIKESIWTSEKISSLSDFEFRVWIALITLADDAGRGDARAAVIRGRAFPLRDGVTNKNVESAVRKLASNGCIILYTVGGRCYYCFPTWNEHQRIRDCKPKYPGPDDADNPPQSAASCGELPQSAASIQSNPNPNTNPNPESEPDARDDAFDVFWAAYPRKAGKGDARKAFAKVRADLGTLLSAIEAQKASQQWQREDGRYIPNPATWLNQCRWEDELPAAQNTSGGRTDWAALAARMDAEEGEK
jgi:hypothetical protein